MTKILYHANDITIYFFALNKAFMI